MRILALAASLAVGLVPSPQGKKGPSGADFPVTVQHALGRPVPAEWQPYFVDMTNRLDRDVVAVVRLEDETGRTATVRREPMSPGTRKRLFLYLPTGTRWGAAMTSPVRYSVKDPAGKRLSPDGASIQGAAGFDPGAFRLGLLSGDPDTEGAFSLPRQLGSADVEVIRLRPEQVPDRWIGLAGLHALILHDARLDELTAEQARALSDYVRQGGTVILSPGLAKGWLTQPALAAFAKVRGVETETRTELPGLNRQFGAFRSKEPFLFHRVEGAEARSVTARRPAAPREKYALEVLALRCGFGSAVILPFDVRRAPFDTWKGLEGLWTHVLSNVPRRFHDPAGPLIPGSSYESRMHLVRSLATFVNPYPSFLLLLGLAVLFLVLVGPVNYLALRRLRMTLLVVVSVPAISLAFLGGVLGIGYLLKGTSTVVHSLRILRTRQGHDCAGETQLYNLFSPSTRTYDVSLGPGTYGLPVDRLAPDSDDARHFAAFADRDGPDRLEFEDGAAPGFRGVGIGQWQSWPMEARALRDLGQGIRFDASDGTLRVVNGSPRAIARGVYLEVGRGGFACPFGEAAPGETVERPLDTSRYDPLGALGFAKESFGGRLLGTYFAQLQALYRQDPSMRSRQHRVLVCVLGDDDAPVRLDARISGDSRNLTLLFVTDEDS
jgi:hypothetical protein